MKKILYILTLVILLFTLSITVSAASSISSGQADKGETVTLDIKLSDTKKVKSGAISFEYDKNSFEIVSGEWKVAGANLTNFDIAKELGAFLYTTPTDVTGVIFKITFKVKSSTVYNKYTVKATLQFVDHADDKTEETISSTITVGCSHDLTVKDTKDENLASKATCTSAAKYYYKCSKCGEKGTKTYEEGQALGHTGGTATCAKKAVCTRCNQEYGNLLAHKFGEWKVVEEATEQKEGTKERVCSECNKKETEKISILGHTHKYTPQVQFESTCIGKGLTKHVCSCGDSYDEIIPAKDHKYSEYEILVEPTETTDGYKQKVCSECGDIKLEKINKLTHEHQYKEGYYMTNSGHYTECICGHKTEIEVHTYGEAVEKEGYKEYTCTACGHIKNEITQVEAPKETNLTIYYAAIAGEALLIMALFVLYLIAVKKKQKVAVVETVQQSVEQPTELIEETKEPVEEVEEPVEEVETEEAEEPVEEVETEEAEEPVEEVETEGAEESVEEVETEETKEPVEEVEEPVEEVETEETEEPVE